MTGHLFENILLKIYISSPTGAGAESARVSSSIINSPAVMTEEEGKQEMTEPIQIQIQSPEQDEGCQAEEEVELENDFFGLNEITEKDNVQVYLQSTI